MTENYNLMVGKLKELAEELQKKTSENYDAKALLNIEMDLVQINTLVGNLTRELKRN